MKRSGIYRIIISFVFLYIPFFGFSQYQNSISIEKILKTDTSSLGTPIIYPFTDSAEVSILKITIMPGQSTGWHLHEIPVFAYILEGTLTVSFEDNTQKTFNKNSSFAEVQNVLHNGSNNSDVPLVLIAFYMGVKGNSLSVKK